MQIETQIAMCQGNLGALTHLFLKNKLNVNSQKIFDAISESFQSLSEVSKKEQSSLLLAYSSLDGCHILSKLFSVSENVKEKVTEGIAAA